MALAKQFTTKLDKLWHRRTAAVRALVVPHGRGKVATFTRRKREQLVGEILDVASQILVRRIAKRSFADTTKRRHLHFVSGRGLLGRSADLVDWADRKLDGPIIYVFWRGKRCLYVGKGKSSRRLRGYQKSAYLLQATRVEVFAITSRSQLARAECLATHLFRPRDNKVMAAKVKWGKACPVCKHHDVVRQELRDLFRMR